MLPILTDLGIRHITILGGEPTSSADLPEIIRLAADHGIAATLVTNGIALADRGYLTDLLECGLSAIDISLKGANEEEYLANTHFYGFGTVMEAVGNVAATGVQFSVSTVLSEESIKTVAGGIRLAREAGARFFSLSFCYDFSGLSTNPKVPPAVPTVAADVALIRAFEDSYLSLCAATDEQFSLMQSYPLCLWNPEVIRVMLEKGQINSVCQLLDQTGLVLDTDFSIIPCNAMSKIKLGRFDEDWNDARSLLNHMATGSVKDTFDLLGSAPSRSCVECELWSICGGGCVSFWINNHFDDIDHFHQEWGLGALGLESAPID